MPIRDVGARGEEAARFARGLSPRLTAATVVTLSGDLGAGKTAFVKAAARELGVREHVTSPTFVIMKIYPLHHQKFKKLVHIDAYRLKGEHHLHVLGWDDLLADSHSLIFVEWPEQAGSAIPADAIRISLRYSGEHEREIEYKGVKEPEAAGAA
jgi:tRNA threonylcarbamoyladenosine biosynthesis protein TsaE